MASFEPLTTTRVKPTQVTEPVPGKQAQQDEAEATQLSAQALPTPEAAPVEEPVATNDFGIEAAPEQELDKFGIPIEPTPAGLVPQEGFQEVDPQAEFQRVMNAPTDMQEQQFTPSLSMGQRAALGFAQTPAEEVSLLGKKFGTANTRIHNGVSQYRQDKNSTWVDADPDEMEIGDLADMSRFAAEMGIDVPITMAGAVAGTFLGGPGPGTLAGGAIGAGIGGAVSNAVGDAIAENAFGIERDPGRMSKGNEALLIGTMGTAFGAAGGKISQHMAKRKVAKELAKGTVDLPQGKVIVGEIVDAMQASQKAGLVKNVDGFNMPLAAHQVVPGEVAAGPTLDAIEVAGERGFKEFQNAQGKMLSEGYQALQQMVKNTLGGAKKGAKGLAATFVKSIDDIDSAEGALIGEFRKRASKDFKTTAAPLAQTGNLLAELEKTLKINMNQLGKVVDLKPEEVAEKLITTNSVQLKEYTNIVKELSEGAASKGGVSLDRMDVLVKKLGKIIKSTGGVKGGIGENAQAGLNVEAKRLNSLLRGDYREGVKLAFDEPMAREYAASLTRFGEMRKSMKVLNNLLGADDLSKESLTKEIFSGGKQGLPKIRAVKSIIGDADPRLWGDMITENMERVIRDSTDRVTKVTDWKKVNKQLLGVGDEALQEIYGGTGASVKTVKDFLKVAEAASRGRIESVSTKTKVQLAQNVGELVGSPFWHSRLRSLSRIIRFSTKGDDLAKLLSHDSVEKAIKGLAPAKRGRTRAAFDYLLHGAAKATPAVRGAAIRETVR